MESKKINQLATNVAPQTSDLTIIGDPITGVSKKITLLQIANLFATTGTVTSVGITETGNALTITGSPITSAGTINIGFAGDATQYVRGDGALADFPTSTGGGSSVSYYLNSSVSQGTIGGVAYREFSKDPISGAGTDITASTNGYIASYITDANDPALLEVPAGNFNCEFYFSVNSNNHNPYVYAEVYKYDGTTFTLIGSSQSVPEYLTNGTTLSPYYFAIPVTQTTLAITDRIAIRIYVNVDTRVVTLHTENNHLCQVVTTFSKGLTSLNNLTRQVQFLATGTSGTDFNISSSTATHTFNLPVASATNTGKLSSTDWSTFNAKQPAIGYTPANDSLVVHLAGTETITGNKTLNGDNVYNGVNVYNTYQTRFTAGIAINQTLSGGAVSSHTVIGANVNGLNVNFPAGGYNSLNFASTSVGNTYTFPNATGTIALTSNLSGYVPYTGATANLDMGTGSFGINTGQFLLLSKNGNDSLGSSAYQGFLNLSGNDGIYLQLNSSNNLSFFGRTSGTTSSQLMTFTRSGNLGIGTPSPLSPLQVVATGTIVRLGEQSGTTGKQFLIGIDATSGRTELQSVWQGTSFTPLILQPSGGSVGIGTTSPTQGKLQVENSGSDALININNTTTNGSALYMTVYTSGSLISSGRILQDNSGNMRFFTGTSSDTERMRITSGGNVGIGTSSPNSLGSGANQLVVGNGSSTQGLTIYTGSTSDANIYFANGTSGSQVYNGAIVYNHSSNYMIFATNGGGERMRITSGGNVQIGGTTGSDSRLYIKGVSATSSNNALLIHNSAGSDLFFVRNDSLVCTPGTYSYAYASTANVFVQADGFLGRNTSSLKYKHSIEDYKRGLVDVLKIRPVLYESKNPSEAGKKFTGFIAEEIDALGLTEFVQYAEDGTPDALQYPHFVALLVKAIQEQQAQIEELKQLIKNK
jgi:hypothetical protein